MNVRGENSSFVLSVEKKREREKEEVEISGEQMSTSSRISGEKFVSIAVIIITGELNSCRAMSLRKIAEFRFGDVRRLELFWSVRFPLLFLPFFLFFFSSHLRFRADDRRRGGRKRSGKKKEEEKGEASESVISEGKFVRRNEIIERRRSRIILAGVRARYRSSLGCHVPLIRGIRIEQLAS